MRTFRKKSLHTWNIVCDPCNRSP